MYRRNPYTRARLAETGIETHTPEIFRSGALRAPLSAVTIAQCHQRRHCQGPRPQAGHPRATCHHRRASFAWASVAGRSRCVPRALIALRAQLVCQQQQMQRQEQGRRQLEDRRARSRRYAIQIRASQQAPDRAPTSSHCHTLICCVCRLSLQGTRTMRLAVDLLTLQ